MYAPYKSLPPDTAYHVLISNSFEYHVRTQENVLGQVTAQPLFLIMPVFTLFSFLYPFLYLPKKIRIIKHNIILIKMKERIRVVNLESALQVKSTNSFINILISNIKAQSWH